MTFLAALRHDRIDAPWFIEGPIDGVSFRTYVEKVLLPALRPGDIVVLDNLGSHKSKAPTHPFGRRQTLLPAKILAQTRSNRSLSSSSTCFAKLPREPSTRSAPQSATHLIPSPLMNAPITSKIRAIELNAITPLVVASVLMSVGMMTRPPVVTSLPFKLIFFVLIDGWSPVAGSLVQSYSG